LRGGEEKIKVQRLGIANVLKRKHKAQPKRVPSGEVELLHRVQAVKKKTRNLIQECHEDRRATPLLLPPSETAHRKSTAEKGDSASGRSDRRGTMPSFRKRYSEGNQGVSGSVEEFEVPGDC